MARTQIDLSLISGLNTTFVGLGRNRIINGDMQVDQANGGSAVTVAGAGTGYGPDQFIGLSSGSATGVFTIVRDTTSPPTGFERFLKVTCTTADASIAASDAYFLATRIEGYNVRDFMFGQSTAQTVTLSFWVKSSLTGIYSGGLVNSATNRSYPFEYTVLAANTWEAKSITLTGDLTGTWLIDNNLGLEIRWSLAVGSTFQGTVNSWQAGNFFATTNQVNFMSSNTSRTWNMTGVQLEIGPKATPFEYTPWQTNIANCQRYYETSYTYDTKPGTSTGSGVVSLTAWQRGVNEANSTMYPFKITKRVTPTMTAYLSTALNTTGQWTWENTSGAGVAQSTTITADSGMHGFRVNSTVSARLGCYGHFVADSRL